MCIVWYHRAPSSHIERSRACNSRNVFTHRSPCQPPSTSSSLNPHPGLFVTARTLWVASLQQVHTPGRTPSSFRRELKLWSEHACLQWAGVPGTSHFPPILVLLIFSSANARLLDFIGKFCEAIVQSDSPFGIQRHALCCLWGRLYLLASQSACLRGQ